MKSPEYEGKGAEESIDLPDAGDVEAKAVQPEETEQPTITVEEAKERALALQRRLEEAQQMRQQGVTRGVADREKFIGLIRDTSTQLQEAKDTLNFFTQQQEAGLLTDPKDIETLESVRSLVQDLENQEAELEASIAALEKSPDILGKVQGEAMLKNVEQDAERELRPLFENLTRAFAEFSERRIAAFRRRDEFTKALDKIWQMAEKKFQEPLESIPEKSEFREKVGNLWNRAYEQPRGWLLSELRTLRDGLGVFQRKERRALDEILKAGELFEMLDAHVADYKKASQECQTFIADHLSEILGPVKTFEEKRKHYDDEIFRLSGGDRRLSYWKDWMSAMNEGFKASSGTRDELWRAMNAALEKSEAERKEE